MTPVLTVAVAETDRLLALPGTDASVLTDAERRRLAAARTGRARADFLAAHVLARMCVARRTGGSFRDVVLDQRCPLCAGPHGRPRVTGARCGVSLSYADGVVAASAADHPVGIDVERLPGPAAHGAGPGLRGSGSFLTRGEIARIRGSPAPHRAFLRIWVRKEALVKLSGRGLPAMAGVDLSHLPLAATGRDRPYRLGRRLLYDLPDVPSDVIGAVAVSAPDASAGRSSTTASGMQSLTTDDLIDTLSFQGEAS
ncbi:4'-phosphopantetheinyl transferase superfamily protein [Streptomyces sp. MC1]|uniref:4'-phosphopantetheinyl transferase family protein n=1 Tax=Streptomyces sp. MC1 TaxID=295105 RepID=UPI0018CAF748|nr:4'-phosphopantetheinyl transferase superfamily protein [Streptomyces sp. MC1]MBG7697948.1 4'-phosphopantetheinyl transferase superfamily protein [Streptomyces sp. MC1]